MRLLIILLFLISKSGLSQVRFSDNQWGEMYYLHELSESRQVGLNLMGIGLCSVIFIKSPNSLVVIGYLGLSAIGLGTLKYVIAQIEMRRISKKFKRNKIILANE